MKSIKIFAMQKKVELSVCVHKNEIKLEFCGV